MLSEEQVKRLVSANESLQIQLDDANAILAAREQEIEFLGNELSEATVLRSKLDGQMGHVDHGGPAGVRLGGLLRSCYGKTA